MIFLNRKIKLIVLLPVMCICLVMCKKGPGPGGRCSISGKIWLIVLNNVNDSYYKIDTAYYAGRENVFLSYGDEPGVAQVARAAEDGTYLFEFLRPGKYKVYAVSKDTTNKVTNAKHIVSMKEIEITGRREQVVLEDIVILR